MKKELPRLSAWHLLVTTFLAVCLLWGKYIWGIHQSQKELAVQFNSLESLQATFPKEAMKEAQKIRAKAIRTRDDRALGQAYYYLARFARNANRFSDLYSLRAYRLAKESHEILKGTNDQAWTARSYALLAGIQTYQLTNPDSSLQVQAYQEHLQHLDTLREIAHKIENQQIKQIIQASYNKTHGIGTHIIFQSETDSLSSAISCLEKAFNLFSNNGEPEEAAISARALANTYTDLAINLLLKKDTSQANSYIAKANRIIPLPIQFFQSTSDSIGLSHALYKKAEITEALYRIRNDTTLLFQALEEYKFAQNSFPQSSQALLGYRRARLMFASAFYPDGLSDQKKLDNYFSSHKLYIKAAETALQTLDLKTLKAIFKDWDGLAQVEDSLAAYMKRLQADLLPKIAQRVSEQEAKVQLEIRKTDQATLQQQQIAQRQWLLLTGGSFIAILIGVVLTLFQQRNLLYLRERLWQKIRLAQTRMNPHFIGNTLNALDNLILQGRNAEASKYLVKFSKMAKDTFRYVDNPSISLEEELGLLENYLSLEKLRVGEDFHYQIEVDPKLDKQLIKLPPMLMQPLVENAIWHGLQPILIDGKRPGHLRISFEGLPTEGDVTLLVCKVEDNGIGRPEAKDLQQGYAAKEKRPSSTQVILERLDLIGHERADLKVIDLKTPEGNPAGTLSTLYIPLDVQALPHPKES